MIMFSLNISNDYIDMKVDLVVAGVCVEVLQVVSYSSR